MPLEILRNPSESKPTSCDEHFSDSEADREPTTGKTKASHPNNSLVESLSLNNLNLKSECCYENEHICLKKHKQKLPRLKFVRNLPKSQTCSDGFYWQKI